MFAFVAFIPVPRAGSVATLNLATQRRQWRAVQTNVLLTVGTVYVICLVWDGTNGVQTCYVNGVPQVMGHVSGLTPNRVDAIQVGPFTAQTALVYTLGD